MRYVIRIVAFVCALTTFSLATVTDIMIQAMSDWRTCDTCAGSGSPPHTMPQHINDPSMTGNSAQYWLGGSAPYHSAICEKTSSFVPITHS